jgi:Cutinase
VSNGAYTPTNGSLDTFVDGVELTSYPYSSDATTTEAVSAPAQGGVHSITATANSTYGESSDTATYGFTVAGPSIPTSFAAVPWVTVPDPNDADDPSATNFTPTLSATSSDIAPETTTFEVRSAEDGTSASLVQTCTSPSVPSGGTATCTVQPLAAGTYYVRSQATDGTYTSAWSAWSTFPVSSIVNTEVLPAAVVTCPGIINGQWDLIPPATSFNCQVTAAAAPSGTGTLDITIDGQSLATVALSASTTTTTAVPVPAGAAGHDIETEVVEVTNGPATDSASFTFGSGNWSNANLVPNISNGGNSDDLAPALWVTTDGAPLTNGTTIQYTLATNPDGTGVLLTTSASPQPMDTSSVALTDGATYYWQAVVQGPENYDGSPASLTSPWFSFVLTDPTAAQTGSQQSAAVLHADATSTTPTRCGPFVLLAIRGLTSDSDGKLVASSDGYTYTNSTQTGTPTKNDGYGDPPHTGGPKTGDPEYALVKALRANNPLHIYTEAIDYPATLVFPYYWDSVAAGRKSLVGEMNNLAKECPNTQVLVSGHSMGAQVISQEFGQHYSDSKGGLSTQAKLNFLAATLTADPTYLHGEKIDAAGNGTYDGVFTTSADKIRARYSLDGYRSVDTSSGKIVLNIRAFCKAADQFCQDAGHTKNSSSIHNSYGDSTTVSDILAFFARFE